MNHAQLRVTSSWFWHRGALAARWCRRLSLAAVSLAGAVAVTVLAAATGRPAGSVAHQAAQVAWAAAFIVPVSILLGRMERTFTAYAETRSP